MGGTSSRVAGRPVAVSLIAAIALVSSAFGAFWLRRRRNLLDEDKSGDHATKTTPTAPPIVVFGLGGPEVSDEPPAVVEDQTSDEERAWAERLVVAAAAGDLDAVQAILEDVPGGDAATPMEKLLSVDAHLPATSWVNMTALAAAALSNRPEVLKTLMAARADADVKCQNASSWDGAFTLTQRDTALCIAAKEGHMSCVRALLEGRADPNVRCDSEYFEGAVEWGEDDDGTENMLYSALDVANSAHQKEIAELIKAHGGQKIVQPTGDRPRRKMISSGSRMGA